MDALHMFKWTLGWFIWNIVQFIETSYIPLFILWYDKSTYLERNSNLAKISFPLTHIPGYVFLDFVWFSCQLCIHHLTFTFYFSGNDRFLSDLIAKECSSTENDNAWRTKRVSSYGSLISYRKRKQKLTVTIKLERKGGQIFEHREKQRKKYFLTLKYYH